MNVFLGLGANLGQPLAQLQEATRLLSEQTGMTLLESSSFYQTSAWGDEDQPDFVNSVLLFECTLEPPVLLQATQSVESALGRVRKPGRRWGPRLMDIDILLYGEQTVNLPGLVIPHPWLCKRIFVLRPLLEIAPGIIIPDSGSAEACLQELPEQKCVVLNE